MPWTIIDSGIIITFIIGLLFYLIGRNIAVHGEVIKRSSDLEKTLQELSNKENRLQAILNTVLDGIITITDNGIIKSFNPAAVKIFGYDAYEVIDENIAMLMPEPYKSSHDT